MKLLAITLVLCLNSLISHVVSIIHEWPLCSGGASLLGLNEWDSQSLRCCDPSGSCHGYNANLVAVEVADSLQNLLNATLPIERPRFKRNFDVRSQSASADEPKDSSDQLTVSAHEDDAVSPLCSSKVSVFYPVTGFSATSRKRVAIIQIGPFKQPVIYDKCTERASRILRGNCSQVYSPQPLYILTTDEGGKLGAKLDFVLVEAGCQCQTRPLGSSAAMGVDATVREALRIITGSDFDEDYLAMLAAIDAASAIAGPNQAATTPPAYSAAVATAAASSVPLFAASSTAAPAIDPHQLGNPTATPPPSSIQTEMITSPSESSHDLSDNEITSPPPPTTILPLPELPDHGQPILIPSGHFNPVLLSIQKFLNFPLNDK